MRVLYADHTTQPSGGQLALIRLVRNLPAAGVDAIVLAPDDGLLFEQYRSSRIPIVAWRRRSAGSRARSSGRPSLIGLAALLQDVRTAQRHIRAIRPDVVHTNSIRATVSAGIAAKLTRTPLVVHVRDRISRDAMGVAQFYFTRLLLRVLPDAVVANSRVTLSHVPRRASSRYEVIPSPCEVCMATPDGRQPLGPGSVLRMISLSRLVRWKGQDVLLRALRSLVDDAVTNFHLTVYGAPLLDDDGYERELRQLVKQLDLEPFVTFAGHVEDIEGVLQTADLMVHTATRPEPFGQVVVEGMSCGLAVVASLGGGPAEIIAEGKTGLLVPPGDPAALAATLRSLVENPDLVRQLGEAARNAVERYRPQPVAEAAMRLYASLLT